MNTNRLLPLAAWLLLAGCQVAVDRHAHDSCPPGQGGAIAQELRQASAEWDAVFDSGDAAKLASLYADDAISMPPGSVTVQGRAAIQSDFESLFAANIAHHKTFVDQLQQDGNLAVETARYRLTSAPRAGGNETVETGRHVECRRKIDGKWRIVVEIWNTEAGGK